MADSTPDKDKKEEEQQKPQFTDLQILAAEQAIRDDEARVNALISLPNPLGLLLDEYSDNPSFLTKIHSLFDLGFSQFRKCRGDGNCFYRAFTFAYFARTLTHPARFLARTKRELKDAYDLLLAQGFDRMVIEDFMDVAEDTVRAIEQKTIYDLDMLTARFQVDEISNALVVIVRFAVSAYLQLHEDEYYPFVMDDADSMLQYCNHYVEAVGRDADHIHLTVVSKIFHVNFSVAYLDAGSSTKATIHTFEGDDENKQDVIALLYRPGHYDLLYRD
ncbi:peptidase C65 Otubain-domain-containing protein [Blastocladiella britannica]|nr:peptidase C65 Otubain-domain-containing protein [Blastocladiella britannica]